MARTTNTSLTPRPPMVRDLLRRWARGPAPDIALGLVAVIIAVATDLLTTPDNTAIWALGTLGPLLVIAIPLVPRTIGTLDDHDDDAPPGRRAAVPRRPVSRWLLLTPAAVAIALAPTLLTGGLDEEMSGWLSLLLFALLGYVSMLLGVMVAFMVVLPIAALATYLVARSRGQRRSPVPALIGLMLFAVLCFGVGATLGLDYPSGPGNRRGLGSILALYGVFDHRVISVGWLWFGRISGVVIVALVVLLVVVTKKRAGDRVRTRSSRSGDNAATRTAGSAGVAPLRGNGRRARRRQRARRSG